MEVKDGQSSGVGNKEGGTPAGNRLGGPSVPSNVPVLKMANKQDRIAVIRQMNPVVAQTPLTPLVQVNEAVKIQFWVDFLNDSFRLPGGRQIQLQIIRDNGRHFDANWINGHVNLAACDITYIKLVDDKQFCFNARLDSETLKNTLPYFLPLSAFNNVNNFDRELNYFNLRNISFDQVRFVQWAYYFKPSTVAKKVWLNLF